MIGRHDNSPWGKGAKGWRMTRRQAAWRLYTKLDICLNPPSRLPVNKEADIRIFLAKRTHR